MPLSRQPPQLTHRDALDGACFLSPAKSRRDHKICARMQADAPAQAPVAAKTKKEAIAISENVSGQQQAPPKKAPAPVDPQEAQRRRESGGNISLILMQLAREDSHSPCASSALCAL